MATDPPAPSGILKLPVMVGQGLTAGALGGDPHEFTYTCDVGLTCPG